VVAGAFWAVDAAARGVLSDEELGCALACRGMLVERMLARVKIESVMFHVGAGRFEVDWLAATGEST
jgi:hypothetical protein